PVVTGSGTVKCAHGIMPVPTPATASLLKGAPLRGTSLKGELTTPTGAAILATLVDEWIDSPSMNIEAIGHGAGQKELMEQPNMLRVLLGTSTAAPCANNGERDRVWVLETNLDDVPGEIVGYAMERLFAAGAVDVFSIPVTMKKQRPGVLLTVLVPPEKLDACEEVLFQETQTFGIRRHLAERTKLRRESKIVKTPWGEVMGKVGWRDGKTAIFTPEYEDCARAARSSKVPLREVYEAARRAFGEKA
ncbi:MAG: LarC family nickel insertion protein, partial [Gemmataceae bacterium]